MGSGCSSQSVLVVYFMAEAEFLARPGLLSSIYAIENSNPNAAVEHLNIATGSPIGLLKISYNIIVFHYSVFAERMSDDQSFNSRMKLCDSLVNIQGRRVAIVQDEYVRMNMLCNSLIELGVDTLCTCVPESEFRKAYPQNLLRGIKPVFAIAGYIDQSMRSQSSWLEHESRTLDIFYRARRLPRWLGATATTKYLVAEKVTSFVNARGSGLLLDISTNPRDVLSGGLWNRMLKNSRTVLGSQSGVSILDFDGSIHDYSKTNTEEETIEFSGAHGLEFDLCGISPRHFEAASSKTCQLLVEGDYSGILDAGRHYIPIKTDFSNLDEVIECVEDVEKCEHIAEVTFREIVQNERYSEKYFVNVLLGISSDRVTSKSHRRKARVNLLKLHNLAVPLHYLMINAKLSFIKVINLMRVLRQRKWR